MKKLKKYSEWEYEEEQKEEHEEESDEEKSQRESEEAEAAEAAAKKQAELDAAEVEIEVDGKKEKIAISELKKGYLRQSDYTKKTQELSEKEKKALESTAKKVVENPEEFPPEDVKAAEYFLKIGKAKFGLMTREEYDAEESKKKTVSEFQSKLNSASTEVGKMQGMPEFNEDEIIEHMQKTGIHNPLAAYKDKYEAEYLDYKIKLKGDGKKGYFSEKNGEKIEPKKKEYNMRNDESHRDYLKDELAKMSK